MRRKLQAFTAAFALGLALAGSALVAAPPSVAQTQASAPIAFGPSGDAGFDTWRADFAARALAQGRSREVVTTLLSGLSPDPRAIRNDQSQAEFVRAWWDYVERAVSPTRIAAGLAKRREDAAVFAAVAQRYNVDPGTIAGIWGIESNFGEAALPFEAPRALATLAYEGRRRAQFETWLLALMQMVERGYAGPSELRSSWAGALGQPQFMPDIYLTRAVDWDGDGRRDIWTNDADVIASIANYLAQAGWRAGEPIFTEVRLPADFNYALADRVMRPGTFWQGQSLSLVEGSWNDTARALQGELFLPAGANGPALLLHANFDVIRRYNPSDRYALAVALIGKRVEGGAGLSAPWPSHLRPLTNAMARDLQTGLNAAGHSVGTVDGVIGSGTRAGLRAFQIARGIAPPDGFPTYAMVEAVRAATTPAPDPALSRDQVRELQRLLTSLGYTPGAPDGRSGARTRAAVQAFERSLGRHTPTGRATASVLRAAREFSG
ncbi:MAG: lytic murein transglycosylase [Caulobacterales bacterium]|jgi:lytic murein transglycosylase